MDSRSDLSRRKDEFNFAFSLANDLQLYLDNNNLSPRHRQCMFGIHLELISKGKAKSAYLTQLRHLLGEDTAQTILALAKNKAMLETDFVNS